MTVRSRPLPSRSGAPTVNAAAPLIPLWPNFRDLGGIPVEGGRRVRPGRFFRAPAPTRTDAEAEARLRALDPAVIIDFRGEAEAEENPADLPDPLAERRIHLAIEPSANRRYQALFEQGEPAHEDVMEAMSDTYRDFVRVHSDIYARFLVAMREADGRPVIFHCTAGKDRTGFAAALVLAALGAESDHIERDYLLSRELWKPDAVLEQKLPISARAAVFGVESTYLYAALEELDRVHGGATPFAEAALGGSDDLRKWIADSTE